MGCEHYIEMLSAQLDGALSDQEQQQLQAHLEGCPQCRELSAQLEQLGRDWAQLEELEAPPGFAQGVTGAIARQTKIHPLFRGVQRAAMSVVAAGLVLVVVLYQPVWRDNMRAGGAAPAGPSSSTAVQEAGMTKTAALSPDAAPQDAGDGDLVGGAAYSMYTEQEDELLDQADQVLVLEQMPQGALEVLGAETAAAPAGDGRVVYWLTPEQLDQIRQLAEEQGLLETGAEQGAGGARCALVVPEG